MTKKHIVTLTEAERTRLRRQISTGSLRASTQTHARILLKANRGEAAPSGPTGRSARAGGRPATVARVRQAVRDRGAGGRAASQGARPGVSAEAGRRAGGPPGGGRLQRAAERPKPVELRLLADTLVELEVVEAVSYETVRQTLKQTSSNRG